MNRSVLASALLYLAAGATTQAMTPARPNEVLCWGTSAFLGTVVDARSHDCRLTSTDEYCYNRGTIGLTVRVDELLQPVGDDLKVGDLVQTAGNTRNGLPMQIAENSFLPMNETGNGDLGFPATGKAITDAEAKSVLVGHQYMFAITRHVKPYMMAGEPWLADIYDTPDYAFVRETWPTDECRSLAVTKGETRN